MKIAFAHWDNRIAPVFDTAQNIRLLTMEADQITEEKEEIMPDDLPIQKAERLSELGVSTLVCGAISRPMRNLIEARGIALIPFIAGELREVINAWLSSRLQNDSFAMPGCCGRNRLRGRGMGGGRRIRGIGCANLGSGMDGGDFGGGGMRGGRSMGGRGNSNQ